MEGNQMAEEDGDPGQRGIWSGSQAMIGEYQKTVGRLMKKITPEEMEEAEHIAREWNDTHPPPEVQAEYVHIYPCVQCS